jgi:excisionase family DNA binding protein
MKASQVLSIEQLSKCHNLLQLYITTVSKRTTKRASLGDLTSKLISVMEASKMSGLTTGHLRKLLREGQIEGVKIGRNWLTTEEAVQEYLKQEIKPGPKPKQK